MSLTFPCANVMDNMVKAMPGPPEWNSETVILPNAPNELQIFYYWDLEKSAHYLFQWPDLDGQMDYILTKVFDANGNHVYHEMCSAHEWDKQQVCTYYQYYWQSEKFTHTEYRKAQLKVGSTILSVILATDKTHLTNSLAISQCTQCICPLATYTKMHDAN